MTDTAPNTPTRRNRGGSPKQYDSLERITGTWTPELRERFYAITQGSTFHERLRWLVEREEQRLTQDKAKDNAYPMFYEELERATQRAQERTR